MSERIVVRNLSNTLKNLKNSNYLVKNHIIRYKYALDLVKSNQLVIDVACGSGYGSKMLANKGCKVIAIDNSKTALDLCKKFNDHKNIEWILGNIKQVSKIVKDKVDAIICFETLEHIQKDHDSVLRQFVELLKKDRPAICSIPLNHQLNEWHKKVFDFEERENLFKRHFKKINYNDVNKSIIVGWN